LVALAAIGVFMAYRGTTDGPTHRYVTVSRDLAAGTTIGASDLVLSGVDLPDATAAHSFTDPASLVGAVTVAPITKGELVQASAVSARSSTTAGFQVSIPLERARALDGALQAGELLDVLVTYAGTSDARTLVVARRAQVIRVDSASRSAIATSTDLVLVLGLPTEDEALAVTHGSQAGKITLVRATGAGAAPSSADSYQPPADGG
jgi:Flp pilus assembly protein CpaB